MTYTVSVERSFTATHWMPSGRAGEMLPHQHDYHIRVSLEGEELDAEGFLVDIDVIGPSLDDVVSTVKGKDVNGFPELAGRPPSLENFAAAIWTRLHVEFALERLDTMSVTVWEGQEASASFRQRLRH